MEITEELKDGIISYAIYELLHRMREADYENLIDSHPELKELSDEEIVDIILSIAEEF